MALHMTYVGPWKNVLKMGVPNTHAFGFHPPPFFPLLFVCLFVGWLVGWFGLLVCWLVVFAVVVVVFLFTCF